MMTPNTIVGYATILLLAAAACFFAGCANDRGNGVDPSDFFRRLETSSKPGGV